MSLYDTYGIYGIRNIVNDNVYVGKTTASFGDRRDSHWACLRGGYGTNPNLQREWDLYGEENFEFSVLHDCLLNDDADKINDLEIKYIQEYRDCGKCYNIADGGDSGLRGHHLSDEAKRKIGEKNRINMTGRKADASTREKMSMSHKKIR